jgi:Mg2+/Co2+ transporter CorB
MHAAQPRITLTAAMEGSSSVRLHHPNREKPESKATKSAVVLLLLVSAGLIAIITIGGWTVLQGAQIIAAAAVIIYLVMAYYVGRWSRGVLPMAAALAILFIVFAAVAGPAWFERDKSGYENPFIPPGLLGLLTLILIPVEILLIVVAMRGFQQAWNVEIEVAEGDRRGEPQPQAS